MRFHASLLIGCLSTLCFISPAQSAPDITQAVSQDCRWDDHNFCSEYDARLCTPVESDLRANVC